MTFRLISTGASMGRSRKSRSRGAVDLAGHSAQPELWKCDPTYGANACDSGCNGGLMTIAYGYISEAGGLQLEADYFYEGSEGACKFDQSKVAAKVVNFSAIVIDEGQIAATLVKNGSLAIGLNAVFMQTYVGGVSCPYICSKRRLDHGVLLVGYGEKAYAPARMKEKAYWIIKNSWGPTWGEGGYYRICRGHNECSVDTHGLHCRCVSLGVISAHSMTK